MNANIHKVTTRDYVYNIIRDELVSWVLKPGEKIYEKETAERLEVGRTPVREAFLQLAQEDLLNIYPQIGTIVSKIDLNLVQEVKFVRRRIESAVLDELCNGVSEDFIFEMEINLTKQALCVEKKMKKRLYELDEEFHQLLYKENKKLKTWEFIRQMKGHYDRLEMLKLTSASNWDLLYKQHQMIFNCIIENNKDLAKSTMNEHLDLVYSNENQLKAENPEYFQ